MADKLKNGAFVYIVCGDDVHINTLNYSLSCLKKFSKKPIFVITDTSRNTVRIDHDNVIDIKTEESFSNHQAAIFLKTSLHRYLPMDDNTVYCYIDSDLLALTSRVDKVFEHPFETIGFCPDHSAINFFSPNAVHCECAQLYPQRKEEYEKKVMDFEEKIIRYNSEIEEYYKEIEIYHKKLDQYYREIEEYDIKLFAYKQFKKTRIEFLFKEYEQIHNDWIKQFENPETLALQNKLNDISKNKIRNFFTILDFAIQRLQTGKKKIFFHGYIRDKQTRIWYNRQGLPVLYPVISIRRYFKENSSRINRKKPPRPIKPVKPLKSLKHMKPVLPAKPPKEDINLSCYHLQKEIKKEFGVNISPADWQHPNGGFFLFDKGSVAFLDKWHELSLRIFSKPYWKTRDQATLAVTYWLFGLNKKPYLPVEFNYIADYYTENLIFNPDFGFSNNGLINTVKPWFVHVYHHFGDKNWPVWNYIDNVIHQNEVPQLKSTPDSNNVVNGLWIGQKLSSIELMCIYSFMKNGHTFRLWVYDDIQTPLPEAVIVADANLIIPREKVFCYSKANQFGHGKGSYAGFSDIFRYKLLHQEGGWWADMDVLCLKPLNFKEEYVFRTHHDFPVVGNIMKCPKGSEMMLDCYNEAISAVNADNSDWNLPIKILNNNIEKYHLQSFIKEISNPDTWDYVKRLIVYDISPKEQWYVVHLMNEEWRRNNIRKDTALPWSFVGRQLTAYKLISDPSVYQCIVYILNVFSLLQSLKHLFRIIKYKLKG